MAFPGHLYILKYDALALQVEDPLRSKERKLSWWTYRCCINALEQKRAHFSNKQMPSQGIDTRIDPRG